MARTNTGAGSASHGSNGAAAPQGSPRGMFDDEPPPNGSPSAGGFDAFDDGITRAAVGDGIGIDKWHAVDVFTGPAPRREWLITGVFPMRQASLVAAAGGVGKSYLMLELCRACAVFDRGTPTLMQPTLFGGLLGHGGAAVYLSGEDDRIEIHKRLEALGPIPPRLYTVPMIDAGGVMSLFALADDPVKRIRSPQPTFVWYDLTRELKAIRDLALVVLDPLQVMASLDLNPAENAQCVVAALATLASETGASVIATHHFTKRDVKAAGDARDAVRGSGGLVDGVRCVYALWQEEEEKARSLCAGLSEPFERYKVVIGGVVKANGQANLKLTTYVRNADGLLVDRSEESGVAYKEKPAILTEAIANAARANNHFARTKLHNRHAELPIELRGLSRDSINAMCARLITDGTVETIRLEGRKGEWLTTPEAEAARVAGGGGNPIVRPPPKFRWQVDLRDGMAGP